MRIGMFTDTYHPEINGVVTSITTLKKALENEGHEVYIVTTHSSLLQTQYEDRILRLPGLEIKQMYGYVLTSPVHLKAYNIVKDMNLDIIHVHTEFGAGIFGHIIGKMLKLPIVSTYHTTYEDYTHYVNKFNLKTVDHFAKKTVSRLSRLYGSSSIGIIAPSSKTREMLLRYGIQRDIWVVPTGLDLLRFDKERTSEQTISMIRAKIDWQPHEKIITFVGRIAKEKSIDLVIDGFKVIDEMNLPVKFMVVGSGPELEKLQEKCKKMNLCHRVYFLGKVPSDQVPSYYHASSAFVSASLTETQGMTYIEAMASELPVFARFDEVLHGLVNEGETGYFFETPEDFANKVSSWLDLPQDIRVSMRASAKKQIQVYDSRVFAQSVLSVYEIARKKYYTTYQIENIFIKDDLAEVIASNRFEQYRTLAFAETVEQKGLRKDKVIQKTTWEEIESSQKVVEAYQSCIRKLAIKDRTRKEMYDFLTQKTDCTIVQINTIIDRLEEKHYIDDQRYVMSMVFNFRSLLMGKNRIIKSLIQKGIPYEMILEAMSMEGNESETSLAMRLAMKIQPTITQRSIMAKKQKIRQRLVSQGFDLEVANEVVSALDFNEEAAEEYANLLVSAQKAQKKFAKKHANDVYSWMMAVKRSLSTQGYSYSDISRAVDEMEWSEGNEQSESME